MKTSFARLRQEAYGAVPPRGSALWAGSFAGILAASLLLAGSAGARESDRSYELSLRVFAGEVENAGKLDGRAGYAPLSLRNDLEYGVALSRVLGENTDFELEISRLHTSGAQPGETAANSLFVAIDLIKLSATLKQRLVFHDGMFAPWLGGGPDAANLRSREREMIAMAGGPYVRDPIEKVSSVFGAHAGLGLDIYPIRQSSVALTTEARYTVYPSTGSFDGDLDTWSFLLGLRWDFW